MKEVVSTCVKTLVLFKILPCYAVGKEPEPPEPHQNFHPEPEPETHKNDAAPQHWADRSVFFYLPVFIYFLLLYTQSYLWLPWRLLKCTLSLRQLIGCIELYCI
jgi:hypothetical protein